MQILKKITMLAIFMLALGIGATAQVTVTGSTGADGPYTTLGAAFTAINAGTHTGNNITVAISANTTETGPAVLNSGAWTSLTINPTADGVTVAGPTVTGRGLIELNGADSVIIDGDNPNTTGTNRNLTIQNTAANTVTYTSVIRLAVVATAQTSADNDIIRNLVLLGNATGRNVSTATSTTGSENTTFGIYAGGNGGATVPTAITSVTTNTAPSGTTVNNFTVSNNSINACARGVVFNGAVATASVAGTTITNNIIGATPLGTTTVYAKGIYVGGTTSLNITGNTIQNIASFVATTLTAVDLISPIGATGGAISINDNTINNVFNQGTSAVRGISQASAVVAFSIARNSISGIQTATTGTSAIGIDASTTAPSPSGIIDRNNITNIKGIGASTYQARGISINNGTLVTVRNNFVSDIANNAAGSGGFGTSFSPIGIYIGGGTNHRIYQNSVNMFGTITGTASGILSAAFQITGTGLTGLDVRNNIFANTLTGGLATGSAHVAIALPQSGTSAMNLTINNNDYFSGTTAGSQGVAFVGVTYAATPAGPPTYAGLYSLADFNPADTANTANLRTYTNTLSAAGTNDNASQKVDPLFVSTTDLHIPAGSSLVDAGAVISAGLDIDGQTRVDTNDIGADETDGVTPPANDIAATAIIVPANGAAFAIGATVTPQASFTNVGTAAQTNVQVQFTITGAGGYNYTNTQTIASISPNQTVTVTFAAAPAFTTAGSYTTTATVLTADQTPANNTVTGNFQVVPPVSGTVSVGTGQTYTSLTNAGGLFAAINAAGASSNITINITSDLTGETGAVALNEVAGGFTVTIKPSGAARSITGVSTGGLIILNSADNVTIDGSLSGGTDRSLTVTNTGAGGVIQLASGTNGANNDTVKNLNVSGNAAATITTLTGISTGGATVGSIATSANTNIVIENNNVQSTIFGIAALGTSAAVKDTGVIIRLNTMTGTGNNRVGRVGIYVIYSDGVQITRNSVSGIVNAEAADAIGIAVGTQGVLSTAPTPADVTNAVISRNNVGLIQQTATYSAVGIVLASGTTGTNTIVNNFVSGVIGNSNAGDLVAGIYVVPVAGATQNIYFNSVSMSGDRGSATSNLYPSFALAITADQPVNVLDNILVNTQTRTNSTGSGGESVAFGTINSTFANLTSNYNDLYVAGANGAVGLTGGLTSTAQTTTAGTGVVRTTLADWQTATGKDANSVSVDPLFVSTTDLHIQPTSPVIALGTSIAGVTTDFDGQTRDTVPDIGADEIVSFVAPTVQFSAATYMGAEGTSATVTVTRTGDVTAASTVNYATSDGTATGGAACGTAGVDYQPASGTLSFAAGEMNKTFTITICSDSLVKGNETVNLTLSTPTGATLGAQSTAVLTITNVNPPMPGTLALSAATYSIGEAGGTATITVNRTGGTDGAVAVNYSLTDGTATGGATCGGAVDYVNTGGTVSFLAGEAVKTFTVTICNDTALEGNETFNVTLSGATGGATVGTPATAVVTILDDEVAQPGTLQFNPAAYTVGEAGPTVTLTVTRTGGTDGAVSASYSLANGTATGGGSCAAGVDFINTGGSVSFTSGQASQTITVTICNDTLLEGSEAFTATLASPTGGATIGSAATATVTIIDDEVAQNGTLTLSAATYTVAENVSGGNLTVTVNRTGGTDGAVSATYALTNGTATGGTTCAAGVDYINTGGTVSFIAGQASQTFTVAICNDALLEGNETFNVTLSNATGGATVGTPATGVVTILDDEVAQPGILALSAATYTVSEAATSVTITVNRTGGTDGAVAVNYALTNGTATGGATCAAGVDYINTGGTVSFATGASTQTFTVTLCPDALNKVDETFNVTLSGATGGATVGTPATAVVTITNDDPTPTISINSVSANEGNTGTTPFAFTVTLSAASGQTVTVNYFTADGTATAGSDYTAIPNTVLTFAPGETTKTITVNVIGDTVVEPNETFNVNLATPTNATIATAQGVGTIVNDDMAAVGSLSISDVRVVEGDSGTVNAVFTVTLSAAATSPVTVNYATANGTATAGSDYVATSGTLTFAAGQTTQTITVVVNGDLLKEANETFFVNLSAPTNATITDNQGLGIITDDDRAVVADFDNDGRTDFSVFRPSNSTWYALQSSNNLPLAVQFGANGDLPTPGDYDGDGATDYAVFRPSNGTWYIQRSSDFGVIQQQFGFGTDKPVQGDYNGDGRTDIAVWRPSNGTWYVLTSGASNQFSAVSFGISSDIPVQGDYDGDGRTDYAVYRSGIWYVLNSANGAVTAINFGLSGDKPLVGDFDGDGRSDYTVYRSGVWYIFQTQSNTSRAVAFGAANDIPTVGDYDGDGIADIAVFRPSMGAWYVLQSSNGAFRSTTFGTNGDIPIPAGYQSLQ